jgi:hypothetical protein
VIGGDPRVDASPLTTEELTVVPTERELMLQKLNLPMLFLDVGTVVVHDSPRGDDSPSSLRHVDASIELPEPVTSLEAASLMCRVLVDPLVARVTLERRQDRLVLRTFYALLSGTWTLDLSVQLAFTA